MTKHDQITPPAYSRAAKRRQKRERTLSSIADEFGIAPSSKRGKDGCFVERKRQVKEDPREVVLAARCRRLGKSERKEDQLSVTWPMLSDNVGIAIHLGNSDQQERDRLWKVFCDFDRIDEAYHRRILGRGRHAKCGKIEYMPERFEVDPSLTSDDRSDEEKDSSVVRSWMRWHANVRSLSSADESAFFSGLYARLALHDGGVILASGERFNAALRRLAEIAGA